MSLLIKADQALDRRLKPAITRWVCPGWYAAGYVDTPNCSGGVIFYIPILVQESITYDRIGIYVTGAVGGSIADLRIFAWNNGVPGALILSCGNIDVGSTGAKELPISWSASRGYYFLAIRCSPGSPNLRSPDPAKAIRSPLGGLYGVLGDMPHRMTMYANAPYADPAPAPTGLEPSLMGPTIQLREAS